MYWIQKSKKGKLYSINNHAIQIMKTEAVTLRTEENRKSELVTLRRALHTKSVST
jgi:hypothetical protein